MRVPILLRPARNGFPKLLHQRKKFHATVIGWIFEQLARGFSELTPHSDRIAASLMVAAYGNMDDRLKKAAIGGTAIGPCALNHLMRFEKLAPMNHGNALVEAASLMRTQDLNGQVTHVRVDSVKRYCASGKPIVCGRGARFGSVEA